MGIANVSAVDVDDCDVNDSAVCAYDLDAYENAGDSHVEQQILDADSNASKFDNNTCETDNRTDIVNYNCDSQDSSPFQILSSNFEIQKKVDGKKLDVKLIGRLDVDNTPNLESLIKDLDNVEELTLDFKDVNYISSAALRVLNSMQNVMDQHNGSMKLINVSDDMMFIFDLTGFSDILTVE